MRKILVYLILSLLLVVGVNIPGASATLFLSGDSNISNSGLSDSGNKQFFKNILQGGSKVVVLQDSYDSFGSTVNTFYNTVPGVTSTMITGTVTSAQLTGAKLFVSSLPDDPFTSAEISVFSTFLSGGGSIFFLGENQAFPTYNGYINNALAALGSGMSIIAPDFDYGYHTATGPQIAVDPFTTGVSTFTYAAPSTVSGGTQIFFGTGGQPFVAYEGVVPIPTSMLLLGSGLLGLGGWRRFRNS
jgi:hypothetical protein